MLVQKFEEQVAKTPNDTAIKATNKTFTYMEFDEYTDRIAHSVIMTAAGDIVGLLFEHGWQMMAAILGVLKADKIYVPMSVDYPRERLSYMLSDSGASLILTNKANMPFAQDLSADNNIPVFDVDGITGEGRREKPARA
ncbi:MAG TPA: AMP-binding protein, partial [Candidatus Kapabacteria bacterium]|nr:AMP-binding protein [Candidatus Kapabacteria bacterium]